MKLAAYLRSKRITVREFAAATGISHQTVYDLAADRVRPYATTARKVIRATKGAVTWEDLRPLDGVPEEAAP